MTETSTASPSAVTVPLRWRIAPAAVTFIAFVVWWIGSYPTSTSNLEVRMHLLAGAADPALVWELPLHGYPGVGMSYVTLLSLVGVLLTIWAITHWLCQKRIEHLPAPSSDAPK